MSRRHAITTATVVMLIVLRLNIGWHFFSEGVKHYTDPQWTSEGTLRSATGPLATFYHGYLPDFHGLEGWLHGQQKQKPAVVLDGFTKEVQDDWEAYRQEFAQHFALDEKQQKQAAQRLRSHLGRINSWVSSHRDDLETHIHQWRRRQASAAQPDAGDVPFREQRLSAARAALAGELAGWRNELNDLERNYQIDLDSLVSEQQRASGPLPRPATSIDFVDTMMTWFILAVGGLLLAGLFTRTACVAGALFLASVVSMQPFWVSDALPTYNQLVEMFALLTLATTHVGRWCGLDFFVHNWLFARGEATKGKTDALDS